MILVVALISLILICVISLIFLIIKARSSAPVPAPISVPTPVPAPVPVQTAAPDHVTPTNTIVSLPPTNQIVVTPTPAPVNNPVVPTDPEQIVVSNTAVAPDFTVAKKYVVFNIAENRYLSSIASGDLVGLVPQTNYAESWEIVEVSSGVVTIKNILNNGYVSAYNGTASLWISAPRYYEYWIYGVSGNKVTFKALDGSFLSGGTDSCVLSAAPDAWQVIPL